MAVPEGPQIDRAHIDRPHIELERGAYRISTDPSHLDLDAIHAYLSRSYWAEQIPKELVARSFRGSLCFGLYCSREGEHSREREHAGEAERVSEQVGFARVISDRATFAYLCDVYVLEAHRGQGLSKWLMQAVSAHPELQGLRRFMLVTRDAHGLYAQFGFEPITGPQKFMEIARPGLYKVPGS